MTRAGLSRLPCHGCGKAVLHHKDSVCDECRTALNFAATIKTEQAKEQGMVSLYHHEVPYALPVLTFTAPREALHKAFWTLGNVLSKNAGAFDVPQQDDPQFNGGFLWPETFKTSSHRDWKIRRAFERNVAVALREVYRLVYESLQAEYVKGAKEGRNLLIGLASGQITSDEFNTKAARQDQTS